MLRPETAAMTALLALMTALGPLSVDMNLASLPDIGRTFNAGPATVQLTISVYLVGYAVGQILYGPFADRYGRRPVLLWALGLFTLASLACAAAPAIEVLIAARFVQAVGGAGAAVIARAVVRDLYSGPRAGRELSLMGAAMSLAPIIAPVIGGLMQATLGWESVFALLVAIGLAVAATVWRLLPETLRQPSAEPIALGAILKGYRGFLSDARYLGFLGIISCSYAALFAWISGSAFVLRDLYGMDPVAFGFAFGVSAAGYLVGTLLATRVVMRRGIRATIGIGVSAQAAAGALMLLGLALDADPWLAILLPIAIQLAGLGFAGPQAMAGALTPYPTRAGAASSLFGFAQQTWSAAIGVAVGLTLGASAWPMALIIWSMGLSALAIWLWSCVHARAGAPA
jgi:DHA1 family bicyclomycin/chloramphenicol resistance-like MFS transporter